MGKPSPPPTPDYTQAALATANSGKFDTSGPTGSTGWTLRPGADPNNPQPGDYIYSQTLSPQMQSAVDPIMLQLSKGNQGTQDAIYNKETQYYGQRFSQDQSALEAKLVNQGLVPGSAAYTQAMNTFNQNKNSAYEGATNDAITGADTAQNNAVSRLAQLLSSSSPSAQQGGGADIMGALGQQYGGQLNSFNTQSGEYGSTVGTIGSLAGMAAMYFM